ncbi:MAG: DUF1292 domain-containing protein [Bacilli bacterium]|nr:DUF1292 domain-containing protein [Bacilli bacterium]
MKGSFFIKENNTKKECKILHAFKYDNNNFIIYSDGSLNKDGFLNVFSNKFLINKDTLTLLPIEDNEWDIVDNNWSQING